MVDVVDVVVPLRIVEDRPAVLALEQVGVVGVVLEHQMDMAPRRDRLPHGQRDLLQNMRLAVVDDPVTASKRSPSKRYSSSQYSTLWIATSRTVRCP